MSTPDPSCPKTAATNYHPQCPQESGVHTYTLKATCIDIDGKPATNCNANSDVEDVSGSIMPNCKITVADDGTIKWGSGCPQTPPIPSSFQCGNCVGTYKLAWEKS